jgi:serine/threonine protein kinase
MSYICRDGCIARDDIAEADMPPPNPKPNEPRPIEDEDFDAFSGSSEFEFPKIEGAPPTTPVPAVDSGKLGPFDNTGPISTKTLPKLVPPMKPGRAPSALPPLTDESGVPPPLPGGALPPALGQAGLERWSEYSLAAGPGSKLIAPSGQSGSKLVSSGQSGSKLLSPSQSGTMQQPPTELGSIGPYNLKQLIDEGGMGLVYRAEDPLLKRMVALKVLKPDLIRDVRGWKLFLKEAQATAALRDERIATIYQVGEDGNTFYIAMELLQGENLETRLRRGRVSLKKALWIAREAALGLAVAHEVSLVHRDIKPANLWLETGRGSSPQVDPLREFRQPDSREPEYTRLKILDFGLAQLGIEENGRERVVGTPGYMAPEQAAGKPGDARTDIFSLGVVLFRMVTGDMPFKGETSMELLTAVATKAAPSAALLNPQLPPALVELLQKMLCHDPVGRPSSAKEVARILEWIERELDQPPVQHKRPPHRRAWLWSISAGALATLAFAVFWFIINSRKEQVEVLPPIPPNAVLSPHDVVKRIGEDVTVEFTVGHMERGDETTYLYETEPGEGTPQFRVAVPKPLIAAMRRRGQHWPDVLNGALLRLQGKIILDGGYSEILASDLSQFHKIIHAEKAGRPK